METTIEIYIHIKGDRTFALKETIPNHVFARNALSYEECLNQCGLRILTVLSRQCAEKIKKEHNE